MPTRQILPRASSWKWELLAGWCRGPQRAGIPHDRKTYAMGLLPRFVSFGRIGKVFAMHRASRIRDKNKRILARGEIDFLRGRIKGFQASDDELVGWIWQGKTARI